MMNHGFITDTAYSAVLAIDPQSTLLTNNRWRSGCMEAAYAAIRRVWRPE
jgi:hypothetical protein